MRYVLNYPKTHPKTPQNSHFVCTHYPPHDLYLLYIVGYPTYPTHSQPPPNWAIIRLNASENRVFRSVCVYLALVLGQERVKWCGPF